MKVEKRTYWAVVLTDREAERLDRMEDRQALIEEVVAELGDMNVPADNAVLEWNGSYFGIDRVVSDAFEIDLTMGDTPFAIEVL